MSSVIVKDMEMPDSCYHCKIAESCRHYITNYSNRRPNDCPMIALPDKMPIIEPRCEACEAFNKTRLLIPQPERKKGRWIKITTGAMREKYMCSICGRTIEEDGIERLVRIRYPFCHCGAEMTEGKG